MTRRAIRRTVCHFLGLFLASAGIAGTLEEGEAPVNPAYRRPDFGLFHSGRYVYERHCIVCHGELGDGKGEMGLLLPVKPRSFVQGFFKYRSTPPGKLPTDEDLRRTVTHGISGTAMGAFSMLTRQEVTAVIEYVKFFSRRWRKPENFALPLDFPDPPVWLRRPAESGEHVKRGQNLYQAACAACHGVQGDGKGILAGQLKDLWNLEDAPADLRQPHLRCGDDPRDLFRVLTVGLDGTPMVSFAEVLTPEVRWELVAYLMTLRGTK